MTRQRIRLSLIDSMSDECPTCHGAGRIVSRETLITRIDHWLRRYKSKHRDLRLRLELHPDNAKYMTQEKKRVLRGLMWQNFVHLKIEENHDIFLDEFRFFRVKDNSDVTNELGLDKDHASA
jgi:ribonuclease G